MVSKANTYVLRIHNQSLYGLDGVIQSRALDLSVPSHNILRPVIDAGI
jgi:hypothetical protein